VLSKTKEIEVWFKRNDWLAKRVSEKERTLKREKSFERGNTTQGRKRKGRCPKEQVGKDL